MNDIPAGYKQTEVGVIPEDWEVHKLGERTGFRTGPFGSALHKSDYTDDGIPVINPMHIIDGQIVPTRTMTVTQAAAKHLADFRLKADDIIMGRRGDMGRCAVVQNHQTGWLCGTGSIIIRCADSIAPDFLQRVLSSHRAVAAIEDTSVGSTMINLNQSTLSGLRIQCPALPEQRAIAAALSDVDALIDALDRLIAKKRDLKQAAMQQLLTGQTRLPGFSGEWEKCFLSDVATPSKGKGIRKDEIVLDGLPCIRYGEIYTYHQDYIRTFNSFILPKIAKQSQRLQKGDLLFAGSGETAEEIGKCVAFLGDEEAYAGGDIVIFRPVGQNSMYLGYLMNHSSIVEQKARMGQGDAIVHINARSLGQLKFRLPLCVEQTAIAAVLSDMDAEIAALETRRDKTRALKQGMMQELLTGRTRLVEKMNGINSR
ncbi:MAG: restriction endonuclease subunit S [Syntrophales bacterium LBB04]|nr:restriction endonuclease subunit S [Syntrophales bacterium LBB04]